MHNMNENFKAKHPKKSKNRRHVKVKIQQKLMVWYLEEKVSTYRIEIRKLKQHTFFKTVVLQHMPNRWMPKISQAVRHQF